MSPSLDLFSTGAYCRRPGGNLERPDIQKPVISWAAWNIGFDPGVDGNPRVWDRCRQLWSQNGIADFPWLHCHTMADIERLITVAEDEGSPAIGLNIEDVVSDGLSLQEVSGVVLDFWVLRHNKPVHMATLPWVQNEQGWQFMSFAVAALEIFPDENAPSKKPADCIFHAFAEGLKKVTLMYKTKLPNTPATYDLAICHSLYTADDITPTPEAWAAWDFNGECRKLSPPLPPTPVTVRFTRVLDKGDLGLDCEAVGRALCLAGVGIKIRTYQALPLRDRRLFGPRKVAWLNKFKRQFDQREDGVYDKATHLLLSEFFDARARKQMDDWKPPPHPLIVPKQGFSSLVESLWDEYSMGRWMGMSDLGTYNPASTLPSSGKPSDHATHDGVHIAPPARAFDLGFSPQTGQANALARSFFNAMVGRKDVEYVILGDTIWSQTEGLHPYTSGGHEGHVHVSGRH